MARIFRQPFCPVCWRNMGMKNETPPGKSWVKLGEINQWEKPDKYAGQLKPFGAMFSSEGPKTLAFIGHYDVDQDEEGFFPLIKARLLGAVGDWLRRGWLSTEDVQNLLLVAPIVIPQSSPKRKAKSITPILESATKTTKSKPAVPKSRRKA